MTGKQAFIKIMDSNLNDCPDFFGQGEDAVAALNFYNSLKEEKEKKVITENGSIILKYLQLQEVKPYTAKIIGEGTDLGSKKASGSMRKLVTEGFVDKIGEKPSTYQITEKGLSFTEFDN